MTHCRECGADIGEAKFCPECGAAQAERPPEKQKKREISPLWLLALVAACLVVGFALIGDSGSSGTWTPPTSRPATVRLEYKITGTAKQVDLTYNNAQGNTEQLDNARVPWSKVYSYTQWPVGEFAYISAQNQGRSGSVKCQILVDGVELESATSSGEYVIATCSGTVR